MVAFPNGSLNGVPPPKIITGQLYLPTGYTLTGTAFNTAINDRYYHPYFCAETKTFSGMKTYNNGAGDNGETLRLGVYNDDGATGGPGSLVIDAGQITLSGAAALRTLASSFTLQGGRWYWLCSAHNTVAGLFGMSPHFYLTGVGVEPVPMITTAMGYKLSAAPGSGQDNMQVGMYVSTAYGALPSTAVAPTSELSKVAVSAVGDSLGTAPLVGIYV